MWDPSKIAIVFDHRVPAESAKTATNQKKIREFVAGAGHHEVPRHPRRPGRHLPPDPARERLRAPRRGRRRHRQPHDQPRRARRVRVRHRRHRDGRRLGARQGAQRRGAGDDQGGGQRASLPPACSRRTSSCTSSAGSRPRAPTSRCSSSTAGTIRRMPISGRLVICNMAVEAGATSGIVPADEETDALPARGGGRRRTRSTMVTPDPDAAVRAASSRSTPPRSRPQVACPHTVDNVRGRGRGRRHARSTRS